MSQVETNQPSIDIQSFKEELAKQYRAYNTQLFVDSSERNQIGAMLGPTIDERLKLKDSVEPDQITRHDNLQQQQEVLMARSKEIGQESHRILIQMATLTAQMLLSIPLEERETVKEAVDAAIGHDIETHYFYPEFWKLVAFQAAEGPKEA